MDEPKRLRAVFYRTSGGAEPVREWLHGLGRPDSILIGEDLRLVEFGWPVGMPVCRPLGQGLFEVRTNLPSNRTARVIFCIEEGVMYLLQGFIKKSRATPRADMETALARKRDLGV
jgi:phage-related protein